MTLTEEIARTHHSGANAFIGVLPPETERGTYGPKQDFVIRRPARLSDCLGSVLSTATPVRVALSNWDKYFVTNTGLTIAHRAPTTRIRNTTRSISASQRLRDVLRYLSLQKTDLKDICGVSRQTLYDWLAGKFEPDTEKASRLRDLHELASMVAATGSPLRAATLSEPLVGGRSLLDSLRAPRLDMASLRDAMSALTRQSEDRNRHSARETLKRLGFPPITEETMRANLEHNLRGLPDK